MYTCYVQGDLVVAFEENDTLVQSYQTLQCEFIKVKTSALKVIERKLELESSIQDHKQVIIYTRIVHQSVESGA